MTKDEEDPKLKTPLSQSAVQGIVSLTCECGAKFSRQQVPEEWKQKTFYKWKFRYCDTCFRVRGDKAFGHLSEIIKTLAVAN